MPNLGFLESHVRNSNVIIIVSHLDFAIVQPACGSLCLGLRLFASERNNVIIQVSLCE